MAALTLEPGKEKPSGTCECCGQPQYDAYGFIKSGDAPHAVYFAKWSPGHLERGVWLAVVLGNWDDTATAAERKIATMLCRAANDQFQFSLTDTDDSPWAESSFAEAKLSRAQTMADPEYAEFLHAAEHIVATDPRVSRFLNAQ